MISKRWKHAVFVGVVLGVMVGGAVGAALYQIDQSTDEYAAMAQAAHPHAGDDVAALMAYVEDASHSLAERNHAVWALGRLGDARALPILEKQYTGGDCDHSAELCQRELGKAIGRCGGSH